MSNSEKGLQQQDTAKSAQGGGPSSKPPRVLKLEAQLKERAEDANLRRWQQRYIVRAASLAGFLVFAVWIVVMLVPGFPPEVRQQTNSLITHLLTALLGAVAAGAHLKKMAEREAPAPDSPRESV